MVLLKTNTTAENSTIHLNSFYGPFIHGHNLLYLAILLVLLGLVFISFLLWQRFTLFILQSQASYFMAVTSRQPRTVVLVGSEGFLKDMKVT